MPLTDSLRDDILASVPSLRAFAISLSGNGDRADDLVQETLLRALANIDSFQPGSNLPAWLFTILRNLFRSEYRKRRREVEDADGSYADTLKTQPEQTSHVEFKEFTTALIDQHKAGFPVNVFVSITLDRQSQAGLEAFESAVRKVPEVMECYLMTGEHDYLLRLVVADLADFERIHNQHLTRLPSVARVHSSFAMRTVTRATSLPDR